MCNWNVREIRVQTLFHTCFGQLRRGDGVILGVQGGGGEMGRGQSREGSGMAGGVAGAG